MAQVMEGDSGGKKHGKKRPKKHSTHIDMTPMVDLACLLITFFMLTTAFSKPKTMEIVMPDKKNDPKLITKQPEIPAWRTLNILLTAENKVYYFVGKVDPKAPAQLIKSDFSAEGIRKILIQRNFKLYERIDSINQAQLKGEFKEPLDSLKNRVRSFRKSDNAGPIVLIKADENAKYKDIVDIIDEMAIAQIARYAIIDISSVEVEWLKKINGGL